MISMSKKSTSTKNPKPDCEVNIHNFTPIRSPVYLKPSFRVHKSRTTRQNLKKPTKNVSFKILNLTKMINIPSNTVY